MSDVVEWQREIHLSGGVSLKTPRIVPPSFSLPPLKPEDPVLAGVGERFGKILLIVTCTILSYIIKA